MNKLKWFSFIAMTLMMGLLLQNCTESILDPVETPNIASKSSNSNNLKATGEVEIIWKGGNGQNAPDDKRAFADFNAHVPSGNKEAKGEFIYRVCGLDLEVHREIIAEVTKVVISGNSAWFMGQVIYDSKGCDGGDGPGGHSGSCSGSTSGGCGDHDTGHDDGGDDDHHDGGCSGGHDTGHDDGGDDDHTDGGCGDDHDDGGCGGDDHSGGGSDGHSGGPKGKNCRVGQYIFVKVYDGGTPGTAGDEIAWKWFGINSNHLPEWDDDLTDWHLCEKIIIGGNLVVHNN